MLVTLPSLFAGAFLVGAAPGVAHAGRALPMVRMQMIEADSAVVGRHTHAMLGNINVPTLDEASDALEPEATESTREAPKQTIEADTAVTGTHAHSGLHHLDVPTGAISSLTPVSSAAAAASKRGQQSRAVIEADTVVVGQRVHPTKFVG